MTFGLNVKVRRIRRRLTQAELALKVATGANHISRIESGRQNVTLDMIQRLAVALDCEPEDLVAKPSD